MTRALTLLTILILVATQPANAYLHLTSSVGPAQTRLKWDVPRVRWFATDERESHDTRNQRSRYGGLRHPSIVPLPGSAAAPHRLTRTTGHSAERQHHLTFK